MEGTTLETKIQPRESLRTVEKNTYHYQFFAARYDRPEYSREGSIIAADTYIALAEIVESLSNRFRTRSDIAKLVVYQEQELVPVAIYESPLGLRGEYADKGFEFSSRGLGFLANIATGEDYWLPEGRYCVFPNRSATFTSETA